MTDIKLAIALVSDIHAGPDSAYEELCPGGLSARAPRSRFYSMAALGTAIGEVLSDVPKRARVLLCTGDLSASCKSQEIELAARALTDLADRLGVPKKQRMLVPGNHDIDWDLTKLAAADPWYDKYRQLKIVELVGKHAPTFRCPNNGEPAEVSLVGGEGFLYLLDSAHEDRNDTLPHRGRLGEAQRAALTTLLMNRRGKLRCIALHHHVVPFAATHGIPDFSLLEDAGDLMDLVEAQSVPVVFHGHQHYPFFEQIVRTTTLTVVSSGSTTVSYERLPQEIPNTFHVVKFHDLHPSCPKGFVETRMLSTVNGWRPPILSHHRVAARRPFGANVPATTLEQWADDAIGQCERERLVHLEDFLSGKTDGEYCCAHMFSRVIRDQISKSGKSVKVSVDADTDRVVLQVER